MSRQTRTALLVIMGLILSAVAITWASTGDAQRAEYTPAQAKALSKVEDARGRPKKGLNPARQKQTSLHKAANTPHGPGIRKPASKVTATRAAIKPSQVLSGSNKAVAGCEPYYGTAGQCLPDTPPSVAMAGMDMSATPWTCAEVRTIFAHGLVAQRDPQHLDANHDGVACGTGD